MFSIDSLRWFVNHEGLGNYTLGVFYSNRGVYKRSTCGLWSLVFPWKNVLAEVSDFGEVCEFFEGADVFVFHSVCFIGWVVDSVNGSGAPVFVDGFVVIVVLEDIVGEGEER